MEIRNQVSEIVELVVDSFLESEKFQLMWFETLEEEETAELFLSAVESVLEMLDGNTVEEELDENDELEDELEELGE